MDAIVPCGNVMFDSKGEIDVAWGCEHGQVNARLQIAETVSVEPDSAGFYRVIPVGVISCHFIHSELPRVADLNCLPEYLSVHINVILHSELVVHRSVLQHGAIQYPRQNSGDVVSV